MHAKFYVNNPFRPLQWRANRVMQLVDHRPAPLKPRSFDDHYVRVYRRFLLLYLVAGKDENRRFAAYTEMPHVYHAHTLHYHPDRERRQILEARLLTQEPLAEIAKRFSTDELAIKFFEALFFNVRDRLQHKDWIAKQIIGPREQLASSRDGAMTEDQRGFVYRLFAFHGGPLVLDAVIAGLAPNTLPGNVEDVSTWFDDALGQLVRSTAAAAATVLEADRHNVMKLLKLALAPNQMAKARSRGAAASPQVDPEYLEKAVAMVERKSSGLDRPELNTSGATSLMPTTTDRGTSATR